MWVQVVRIRPPAQRSQPPGEGFRQTALPRLMEMDGFGGAIMLRSRTENLGSTATYWRDREALEAAAPAIERGRSEAATSQGFEVLEVDHFEVVALDRKDIPAPGQFVRSTDGRGDPARKEEAAKLLQDRILPLVKAMPGYVSFISLANPDSGRIVTSSTWATEADLTESGQAVMSARDDVVLQISASVDRIDEWEVILSELPTRA